jgi:hypothetical protein
VRPKLGTTVAMRLRFVQSAAQLEGDAAVPRGGKEGYALVASEGERDDGAALGADGSTGTATPAVEPSTPVKEVELKTMPVSTGASSASTSPKGKEKAKGSFTSLSGSDKGGLETVVL